MNVTDVSSKISQEPDFKGMIEVTWRCECGELNQDFPSETLQLVCGGCGQWVDWWDILLDEQGNPRMAEERY